QGEMGFHGVIVHVHHAQEDFQRLVRLLIEQIGQTSEVFLRQPTRCARFGLWLHAWGAAPEQPAGCSRNKQRKNQQQGGISQHEGQAMPRRGRLRARTRSSSEPAWWLATTGTANSGTRMTPPEDQ